MAEASRPNRQIKRAKKMARQQVDEPQKEYKRAVRTNWYDPLVWRVIEEEVAKFNVWSPKAILAALQRRDWRGFKTLTTQVIGRWMDRDSNGKRRSRWSAETLERVKQCVEARALDKKPTRCGILVSNILIVDQYTIMTYCLRIHILNSVSQ
jgi:hypothetical protein